MIIALVNIKYTQLRTHNRKSQTTTANRNTQQQKQKAWHDVYQKKSRCFLLTRIVCWLDGHTVHLSNRKERHHLHMHYYGSHCISHMTHPTMHVIGWLLWLHSSISAHLSYPLYLTSSERLLQWRAAQEDEWPWEEQQKTVREAEEVIVFTHMTLYKPSSQNRKKSRHYTHCVC